MRTLFIVAALVLVVAACGANRAEEALAGSRELSIDVCSLDGGPFSIDITIPYLPFPPGQQTVLEGPDGSRRARV
jgi:hypothetical protein